MKGDENVVIAIDKDKWSQHAIKWASENVITKSKKVTLVHVKIRQSSTPLPGYLFLNLIIIYLFIFVNEY